MSVANLFACAVSLQATGGPLLETPSSLGAESRLTGQIAGGGNAAVIAEEF